MMKVLGFDSWTGGAMNFERLAATCPLQGVSFRVCHIGSWGGDPGRPDEEMVGSVAYKDIRAYGTNRLSEVLRAEAPDAVVFLSTDTFAHRAFNRLCRKQGIPTLHVYHGLVSVQDLAGGPTYKISPLAQAKFILERIPKALRFIWPAYASSLFATRAPLADWVRFASDIIVMASGRRPRTAAPDARTDRCCVYVQADVQHAKHRYGFKDDEVVAVGNPDLDRFGLDAQTVGSRLMTSAPGRDVMYIDTGLVYTGFVFDSPSAFVRHLVTTRDTLARHGYRFVFKPHPDHSRSGLLDVLRSEGIDVCSNAEFIVRLRNCCASIVEPSSLSIVPALLGMPVFLAQYGPLTGQRYGGVLTSYPRHVALLDVQLFADLHDREAAKLDVPAARAWVECNAGPLPAIDMPIRVLDVLKHIVSQRPQVIREAASSALSV